MEKIKRVINKRLININWEKITKWVIENKLETIILGLIILVGAIFRLYKIDQYMTFLGDEGRDAIIVRRLIVDFDPILIGPRTSIGDMYLGPLYYYMMAPALTLALLSPVGPAIQMALLSTLTIGFVWFVGREWFPPLRQGYAGQASIAGLVAAGLYAISPVVITHARHSWNPNIMPFFALLIIYGLWRIWRQHEWKWLIVVGVSFAFVLQSHYMGLLLAPTIGLFWLMAIKDTKDKKQDTRKFLSYTLYAAILFLVLMSPLVIFDARHGWRNFAAMEKFFTERQTTISARPWSAIPKLPEVVSLASTRLIAGKNEIAGKLSAAILSVGVITITTLLIFNIAVKKKQSPQFKAYLLILVWLGFAFIGLGIYKQHIYDHYYGFFFTAPFLLLGGFAESIVQGINGIGKILVLTVLSLLVYVNLAENPLKYPPNRQMQRTIEVSEKIAQEAKRERFNLAVLAERNYEDAYQYFLEKEREPVIDIDALKADETITEQLFVVCEMPKEVCDPTHNPKAEVANFGWSKIDNEWEVAGVTLYRLVHTQ